MSVAVVTVLFFVGLVGVFLLPLLPAWREIRERRDATALPIAADGRVVATYFADRFRRLVAGRLAEPIADARRAGVPFEGHLDDGQKFLVWPASRGTLETPGDDRMVFGPDGLDLGAERSFLREVYAAGDLTGGDDVVLRAAVIDGDARLGRGVEILRWLHADRDLELGPGALLQGRVSCGARLRVEDGTVFERLHAPRIEFGAPTDSTISTPEARRDLRDDELPAGARRDGARTLVPGDLDLPAGTRWVGDLVVQGRLFCRRGAEVLGAVKAHDVRLEENVHVEGSVVSEGDVLAREGVCIDGLILAEGHVGLARACRVGDTPDTATIRAASADIASGTVVHGAVWVDTDEGRVTA